jgi:hypothetical protein
MATPRLGSVLAALGLLAIACPPALADGLTPLGLRPLGGDWESARTIGPGHWAIEGGAFMPMLDPLAEELTKDDQSVYQRWTMLPAWPSLRGLYGLPDGNEAELQLGQIISGGYRKQFLRADAPWPGEYLQALIQLGGGFNLVSMRPMGYIRFPAIYERGAWTFHVGPGGYYLFNQQPIVDVQLGAEVRPFEALHLGGLARLRMDAKHMTPTEGTWAFGGGARLQLGDQWSLQVEANKDGGPPNLADSVPMPRIEFSMMTVRASVTYYNW